MEPSIEPIEGRNGRQRPSRRLVLLPDGPSGDWQFDVERPPLGSLSTMLLRALTDRMEVHRSAEGGDPLRFSHLYLLRGLYPDGASVTELAVHLDITKQAVSQLVDTLERMQLLRRDPDPRDGRGKIVSLTPEGERELATAVRAWSEVEREWAELIGGQREMQRVRAAMFAFVEAFGDWHRGERPHNRPVW